MQHAVRYRSRSTKIQRAEVARMHEDLTCCEYALEIRNAVLISTYDDVQALDVWIEENNIILTGYCDTYYTKQLAQEAAMLIAKMENIVNKIIVLP